MKQPQDPQANALLDQMWRRLDQRIRDLFAEEFKQLFGQQFAGGKLDGGSIGGTIPPGSVGGGTSGQVLTTENGAPFLAAPAAPVLSTVATGGTIAAATYGVKTTYVNAQGETVASSAASITTTGGTSTITITSPPPAGGTAGGQVATGWYAYVTGPGGSTYTRQQTAGSPTAIGTNLTLSAPPSSSGATPPGSNTAGTLVATWTTEPTIPITTHGDLIVGDATGAPVRLALGTPLQMPTPVGNAVAWATPGNFGGLLDPTTTDKDLIYRMSTAVTAICIGGIGDSIMIGAALSGGTPPLEAMATALSINGLTVSVSNQAINGSATDDWFPGSANLTNAKAAFASAGVRLVVIMLGTNDSKASLGNSAATYLAHQTAIADDLTRSGYLPILCVSPWMNATTGAYTVGSPALVAAYGPQLTLLADNGHIFLGDTTAYTYFTLNPSLIQGDLIHPTQTGSDNLALIWARAVQRLVNALTNTTALQRLVLGANLSITSGVLNAAAAAGVNVTTKGDLQGFGSAPTRVPVSGVNGRVLTEDATQAAGLAWKDAATAASLALLTDVSLRNLQDGDTLSWSLVLQAWINSSAGYGFNVLDDLTGFQVVDNVSGFNVISDPLPTAVIDDIGGFVLVADGGANVIVNG